MKRKLKNAAGSGIVLLICASAIFQFFIWSLGKNERRRGFLRRTNKGTKKPGNETERQTRPVIASKNSSNLRVIKASDLSAAPPPKSSIKPSLIAEDDHDKQNYLLTGTIRARDGSRLRETWGEIRLFLDPKDPQFGVEPTDKSVHMNCRYDRSGAFTLKLNIEEWKDKSGVIVFHDHFRGEVLFYREIGPITGDLKLDIRLQREFPETAPYFTDLPADIQVTSLSMIGRSGHIDALLSENRVTGVRDGDTLILGVKSELHGGAGYVRGEASLHGNSLQISVPPIKWRKLHGVVRDARGLPYKDAFVELSGPWTSVRTGPQGEFRLIFTHYKPEVSLRLHDRYYKEDGCSIPTPILENAIEETPRDQSFDLQIPSADD